MSYTTRFGYMEEAQYQGRKVAPIELNTVTLEKWITALRGNYGSQPKPNTWVIYDNDTKSFSAIGVLCDIIEPNNWKWDSSSGYYRHDGNLLAPSIEFLRRVGIPKALVEKVDVLDSDQGKTFAQIADYLAGRYLRNSLIKTPIHA